VSHPELPQAWVPRVLNVALAALLAALLSPIVHLGDKPAWVQVIVVLICLPVVLVIVACLMSAIRPGSLGRLVRRLRPNR
jgi:threonine/homoserine/homoserine lactone efflux protein